MTRHRCWRRERILSEIAPTDTHMERPTALKRFRMYKEIIEMRLLFILIAVLSTGPAFAHLKFTETPA
ncbi:MAG: hypothetical protein ABJ246_05695, partial [Paracoccaceae bacterium]